MRLAFQSGHSAHRAIPAPGYISIYCVHDYVVYSLLACGGIPHSVFVFRLNLQIYRVECSLR